MTDGGAQSLIYVDSNIFISAFEAPTDISQDLKSIFGKLKQKPKAAVTSELTLAELLGKQSAAYPWARQTRLYLDLLIFSGLVDLRPVTRHILIETGDYRRTCREAGRKVSLPDSIHLVTAAHSGCRFVWTADKRFAVPAPMTAIHLDSAGIASIAGLLDD